MLARAFFKDTAKQQTGMYYLLQKLRKDYREGLISSMSYIKPYLPEKYVSSRKHTADVGCYPKERKNLWKHIKWLQTDYLSQRV